ncbi:uncharacterized protein B0T15DRAFT_490262 [Chaetomium strumarium]|uniref:Uncharacterized protein n=1 Tax=Chaetomium strumarium TaxID=1170767 RepID=A0AAJ0H4K7_9PEZI|nr:hypothetical protein B0T15DRAFT_490262 [Chaetomium strumarium]
MRKYTAPPQPPSSKPERGQASLPTRPSTKLRSPNPKKTESGPAFKLPGSGSQPRARNPKKAEPDPASSKSLRIDSKPHTKPGPPHPKQPEPDSRNLWESPTSTLTVTIDWRDRNPGDDEKLKVEKIFKKKMERLGIREGHINATASGLNSKLVDNKWAKNKWTLRFSQKIGRTLWLSEMTIVFSHQPCYNDVIDVYIPLDPGEGGLQDCAGLPGFT